MSLLNLDLHDTPATLGFDPLPAGDYLAQVIDTEIAHSKSGELMLNLTWIIMAGEYAERLVFDRIMLSGSDKAVAFGKRKIKTMAAAAGHPDPNRVEDSEELHGRPCFITVAIREWNGEQRNEIKGYKPLTAPEPHTPAPAAPAQTQAPAPPATKTPPPPARPKSGATPPPPAGARPQTPFDPPAASGCDA